MRGICDCRALNSSVQAVKKSPRLPIVHCVREEREAFSPLRLCAGRLADAYNIE